MADIESNKLDEDLYSRQLYVLGHEAMRKMNQSSVLVFGFDGLAIELVKNIILAGVKSVALADNDNCRLADLGSNFYLEPEQVGQSRIASALSKLQELNRYVEVSLHDGDVTAESIQGRYEVLVMVGFPVETLVEYNNMCRGVGVKFIAANVHGVFGSIFVDLGTDFLVHDTDGERPKDGIISLIQAGEEPNKTVVTVHEDSRHGLSTGDMVKFEECEGVEELNSPDENPTLFRVKVKSPYVFEIESDMTGRDHAAGTGRFTQVKQPATLNFQSLAEQLANPALLPFDFGKFDRMQLHHAFSQGLGAFRIREGRFPSPTSAEDAQAVVADSCGFLEDVSDDHKKTLARLARCSSAVINPMAALFGGIVGQEVLKAVSGKFTPIQQFLYFDAEEVLPENDMEALEGFTPENTRYDDMIAVVGNDLVNRMKALNVFIIGAGAIGCEMLKNWCLMGVGCGGGRVHVTDMDVIEKSNLNRQFLFRSTDVGSLKSETAAQASMAMNPEFNIDAASNRVGKDSENVYNDDFWSGLDIVITALDNVDARLYVDSKCVEFHKPLVDSGTVGTKGSTQVVAPFKTESYASSADPPPVEFPICLLKNFPNKIEHTIQWARDDFEGTFKQAAEDVNKFLCEDDFFDKLAQDPVSEITVLQNVVTGLTEINPENWVDCVTWAVLHFNKYFNHNIQQLLYNFPADSLTREGAKFWSGPKRAPEPIPFNPEDPTHMMFVMSAAALHAENYCIPIEKDDEQLKAIAQDVIIPDFQPKQVKMATTEEEAKELAKEVDTDEVGRLQALIPDRSTFGGFRLTPLEFEKDDPTNWHIPYTTACANLRARNYGIKEVTAHEAKRLAGRIIPAIATTTAMVTGFVCLEILKLIQDKEVEAYRNAFVNMAVPLFTMSEPMEPAKVTAVLADRGEWQWSLWDTLDLPLGNCTLQALLDHFEEQLGVEVNMITYGAAMIYAFFTPAKKLRVRKLMTITDLIKEVAKVEIPDGTQSIMIDVSAANPDTDEDVDLPTARLQLIV